MTVPSAFSDLGNFIVSFQAVEAHVVEVIAELTGGDKENVHALVTELEYNSRLRAADVMYSRFASERKAIDNIATPKAFHTLMVELQKLGERRNTLVHSNYSFLISGGGLMGLGRKNRKLRPSRGVQELESEYLVDKSLDKDIQRLTVALHELETIRQQISTVVNVAK